jgi:hypothetical protein
MAIKKIKTDEQYQKVVEAIPNMVSEIDDLVGGGMDLAYSMLVSIAGKVLTNPVVKDIFIAAFNEECGEYRGTGVLRENDWPEE